MNTTLLKISVRKLFKQKLHFSGSVVGLALGISAFILISLFIRYEMSWDSSNKNYDRIYRIQRHLTDAHTLDGNNVSPHSRAITAQLLEKKYPEIEKITLIRQYGNKYIASDPDRQVLAESGICADSCFFDVFTYRPVEGSLSNALINPSDIYISETMAKNLFGEESALGKTVTLEKKKDFKVCGVYADLPQNSTIRPSFILSFSFLKQTENITRSSLWSGDCMNFVLLKSGADHTFLESKIRDTFSVFKGLENEKLQLCPMKMLYLDYNNHSDYPGILVLLALVGTMILLMAAFNYINLTVANSTTRGKEVAVKKVSGGSRRSLIVQFLSETLVISLLAWMIALFVSKLFLPVFNQMVDRPISMNFAGDSSFILFSLLASLGIGVLSGIYPAIFLSSHKITALFKGELFGKGRQSFSLKKTLVTFQFAMSVFLVLLTLSLSMQIRHLSEKELGFERDNLLYTRMTVSCENVMFDQLRSRILQHPEITEASMSRHIPFVSFGGGMVNWEGGDQNNKVVCRFNEINYDFIKNMGISVVAGRDFSRDFSGDAEQVCLINETAVRTFGWDDPIGKRLKDNTLTVVGVVSDYIYKDMHNLIEPAILLLAPPSTKGEWTFAFRVNSGNMQQAKVILTSEFNRTFPEDLFEFNELSWAFENENSFKVYHVINRIILFFTVFNIVLAIIGLLGLVSYTVARRTKEIGVRKINGSTSTGIFVLLSWEYLLLLIFAVLLAAPMAWYVYELLPGANKLHAQPWIFISGSLLFFVVVLLTTTFQSVKAATRNPVEALRYE